jgi:DNA-binding PadR family transcriptional regulator
VDTTQLLKGVLDAAVLAVVADEDGYGYDVVRRLRESGLDQVGDASVYGTLRRLYASGALTSYVVPSDAVRIASTTASTATAAPCSRSSARTGASSPRP